MRTSSIRVEVVRALAKRVETVALTLPAGATVAQAISASGIVDVDLNAIGIFGRRVAPATRLADGDRIEIYRPLVLDPKEQRRRRARKAV